MGKTEHFHKITCIVYILLFAFIFTAVLFGNIIFQYNPFVQIILMLAVLTAIAGMVYLYTKHRLMLLQNRYKILFAFVVVTILIQCVIGFFTIPNPMYDHGKVFWGAVHWAEGNFGEDFTVYDNYLHHYPQQMGQFLILQLLFKLASTMGIHSFYTVASIAGHLLFAIMTISTFFYLERTINSDCAMMLLPMQVFFLPIYFQSTVSYTDTYSVWSIPVTLLLFDMAFKSNHWSKQLFYGILAGVFLAIGAEIKVTVLIVAIALFFQYVFHSDKKAKTIIFLSVLCSFLLVSYGFKVWSYRTVLQEERASEGMPVTHWLMMGLQGDGSYSWYDEWEITCGVPAEERVGKNLQVIQERLEDMGLQGYLQLLYRKTCRTFGSGTGEMYYNYQYQDNSSPVNWVYEIVLQQGKYFSIFNNLSNAVYLLWIGFGVVGASLILMRGSSLRIRFAPYLAMIGFWIFMMLWESNHRQLINQWSLFLITATIGLYLLWDIWANNRFGFIETEE